MALLLKKPEKPLDIPNGFKEIIGAGEYEVSRFFDDSVYDDEKGYNTYKITAGGGAFVLKKYEYPEDFEDEVRQYSLLKGLPVPDLLGAAEGCILMAYVEGDDLKAASDDGVRACAESLAAVMNAFPMGRGYDEGRYQRYIKRLEKRAGYLKDEPELASAFSLFFERQKEIPLTLSNGDLLPINVLFDGKKATLIDWEFGGFMPYALDITRFIAHSRPNGEVTSFRMSNEQKALFIDLVYDKLIVRPERGIYERDLLLAELNECVEILEYYLGDQNAERGEVFNDYYPRAHALAGRILRCGG